MNITSLQNKQVKNLNTQELIEVFLVEDRKPLQFKYDEVRTTLSMTLEGIEENLQKLSTRNLLPIMGIFSVFDMLGSTFNHKEKSTTANSSIKRCLSFFAKNELPRNDVDALYALRNSIVHNSSLVSIAKYSSSKNYYFRYNSNLNRLIKHSTSDWNGNFDELDGNQGKYSTEINIFELNNLMKECLNNIRELNLANKIELRYSELNEFYYHYFRSIKNKLTTAELEKAKPKFIEKKELIESHITKFSKFKIVALGDNDKYHVSESEKEIEIASHKSKVMIEELKKFLDKELKSNKKHEREFALLYNHSNINPLKYRLIIIVKE